MPKTKHGMCYSPTYRSWQCMHSRCKYPTEDAYQYCGAKGIRVCTEWISFARFLADMGPRPSKKHSIDRIDNSKGYSKDNCRWATKIQQSRNTTQNILITIDGETLCMTDWADRTGIKVGTLWNRIARLKWDPVRAVTAPLRAGYGREQ